MDPVVLANWIRIQKKRIRNQGELNIDPNVVVFVVYQYTIINVMVPMVILLKRFCRKKFPLCWNVRNTPAASWSLSNCCITLALDCGRFTHIMAFHIYMPFYWLLVGGRMETIWVSARFEHSSSGWVASRVIHWAILTQNHDISHWTFLLYLRKDLNSILKGDIHETKTNIVHKTAV